MTYLPIKLHEVRGFIAQDEKNINIRFSEMKDGNFIQSYYLRLVAC